jgi:capsular exopolysaccharide synthesis family protein
MERIQAAIQKAKEARRAGGGVGLAQPSPRDPAAKQRPMRRQGISAVQQNWARLQAFTPDARHISRNRIVTVERQHDAHVPFDMMRTRMLQTFRENNWSSVAITSPSPQCGKTLVTLNLAFSFARQQDIRTLVMDFDLRRPNISNVLGIKDAPSIEELLEGKGEVSDHFVRYSDNLGIASNGRPSRRPAEIMLDGQTGRSLEQVKRSFAPDVVIYDLPPMMTNDDVAAFLPHADCVLLVAAAGQSTIEEIDVCERELSESCNVLGVILNKCEYVKEKYGYY